MKKKEISKLSGESLDIRKAHIESLKSVFPQAVKDGRVDFAALKALLGDDIAAENERYGLNWAGKMDCFRHIKEPATATLKPVKEESVDFDNTKNLFIEGDNLQVLKVLQRSYHGKVKMIYIDPPYNTGNDTFIYPDRFQESRDEYLQRVGDKDIEGNLIKDGYWRKNSRDAGHFHSNWLSMMYPRLFLAKNLLRDDGVIFVSIDDNEVHNLKMVMDEIFGEFNFAAKFVWQSKSGGDARALTGISTNHEYVLCYFKNHLFSFRGVEKDISLFSNPDNDPRGAWRSCDMTGLATKDARPNLHYDLINPKNGKNYGCPSTGWAYSPETMKEKIKDGRILFPDGKGRPRLKLFLSETSQYKTIPSVITKFTTGNGTKEIQNIFQKKVFSFPKTFKLPKMLIEQSCSTNDIVLDFFAGSCPTAHAAMSLNAEDGGNRKYICVQLPEPCEEGSEAYKAGYKTIADIGKERIRRAARKIKEETDGKLDFDGGKLDLGFKVFKLDESNFKPWQSNIKTAQELKKQLSLFVDNVKPETQQVNILYELILKSGLDLNVKVEEKKANGNKYFVIEDGKLAVCIEEKITKGLIEKIIKSKPDKFMCLDKAFSGNDQLKTNTALQMEAENIEFKVV